MKPHDVSFFFFLNCVPEISSMIECIQQPEYWLTAIELEQKIMVKHVRHRKYHKNHMPITSASPYLSAKNRKLSFDNGQNQCLKHFVRGLTNSHSKYE